MFSEQKKKEIAIVHSELCVEKHSCSYVLPYFIEQLRYIDNNDLVHLHASEFLIGGDVDWDILTEIMEDQTC